MGSGRKFSAVVSTIAASFFMLVMAGPASADLSQIPTATVTGPIAVTADSHPFLATDIDLDKYGYVENEYFLAGDAYRYDMTGAIDTPAAKITTGGSADDGKYPFKTRIVVRRPANPADANGVVIAEWNNVTSTQDVEFNWFGDPYFLLKHGYTFVGVTAQNVGVASLKAFDSDRYGTLTVNGNDTVPTGTGLDADALSYDVYSSVVKALKGSRNGVDPLGGITPSMVIASGESQSCGRLVTHYNRIEPIHEVVDAYLLTVCTSALRGDRGEKAIRIITETENRVPRTVASDPDTGSIRHWEVAAASHLPRVAFDNLNPVFSRDFATVTANCVKFPLSRIKWPYTQNAAISDLVGWVGDDAAPPIAPRGEYQASPPDMANQLERDENGIALGAIRYPDVTVPTATNDGINSAAPGGSIFSAFCGLFGSSVPFSPELLHSLYTDQADYLAQYSEAADALADSGFILPEDADRLKGDSREYARLRPSLPSVIGGTSNKGGFQLVWVGTEAPDTTFEVQRASTKKPNAWAKVKTKSVSDSTATIADAAQGTAYFRVNSATVLPGTNISEPETVVTPFSEASVAVKIDRTGPAKPKIVLKGHKVKGQFRGPVRVKVIGKPDGKLPDGTAGVGLNPKSVPKTRKVTRKGKTVIKIRTRDKLGNQSPVAKVVIRIRR
ncbi:MAG TPA: alpha/beta hydrolase domain-containing protein [Solirubrobacterales bacterium]|jgi:hypothetical protein|nr:hypothetical protein [Solirubrobacterales bacterium]HMU26172.1 alpha/beta hydrolase domain-containing protein [Solirubrobacterales bacterium]HMX70283.1 alpha/beta hydrolase domain-containing protein [Solirubrobacterales bacterium]HMY25355.1 alpha/beta hydrolase domain-containing protein [Solirubrobacterales bacterium]HNA23650.1 alpha/beta hydrolase domain-containing protein [Solirubrobacterales bacterium]